MLSRANMFYRLHRSRVPSSPLIEPRPTHQVQSHAAELRSEFFHCCILADSFTSLLAMQSYLCDNRATKNSLINIAKPPRHEASQPTDPGRGMSVADDDAGAKSPRQGRFLAPLLGQASVRFWSDPLHEAGEKCRKDTEINEKDTPVDCTRKSLECADFLGFIGVFGL